jgi:hypothetical protein
MEFVRKGVSTFQVCDDQDSVLSLYFTAIRIIYRFNQSQIQLRSNQTGDTRSARPNKVLYLVFLQEDTATWCRSA